MKKPKLSSQDTLQAAVSAIFLSLSATIIESQSDALNRSVTEPLHDYRVAIRRTRCLLSEFKSVYRKQAIGHFRKEFFWLFGATSLVRDIDVHIANIEHYKTLIQDTVENDWDLLNQHLLAEQKKAYADMAKTLHSERYRELFKDWSVFLHTKKTIKAKYTDYSIGYFADQCIRINYLSILKQGQSLTLDAPDELWHDLRKQCKKLRYLLEFFGEFYDAENSENLLNCLKNLQDNLGSHQDLCVQIHFLQQSPPEGQRLWTLLLQVLQTQKRAQREQFKKLFFIFTGYPLPTLGNS